VVTEDLVPAGGVAPGVVPGDADLETLLARDPALDALSKLVAGRLGDDPAHDVHHAMRVARWTVRLAGEEDGRADDDPRRGAGGGEGADELPVTPRLALAAALLHDVVNVPKNHPDRSQASARSAAFAREVLRELRFRPAEVRIIAEAIEDHSFSRGATPRSALGRALQDADRLEALGAIGICRVLSTGARMGSRYFDPADPWAERRELDDKSFSVDHFFTKLLRLPETMQTAAGRAEATRRADTLHHFLDALADELDVPRPGSSVPSP
jgi:uncharacterized protein